MRGTTNNPSNKFHQNNYEYEPDLADEAVGEEAKTQFIPVHPKTMVNKVDSPDIPFSLSLNPYQGCEHGCIYCYARNTHPYWGYSAGLDFEQKILVKHEAPAVLEAQLKKKNWKAQPIMLAGNTDCYQPAEKKFQLTRQILEVLWKYRHPVGLITKNKLILRDLDILSKMAEKRLGSVAISITTLQEDLRRKLEPRTSTGLGRVEAVRQLSEAGIHVHVMAAPIIPGLNDHEIFQIAEEAAKAGAKSISYTMVRLNGDVGSLFEQWLEEHFPDRKSKVLEKIRNTHDGSLSESRMGIRMRGVGNYANIIKQQFKIAREKYKLNNDRFEYNLDLYEQLKKPQMKLF